jgi:hypothetical protein
MGRGLAYTRISAITHRFTERRPSARGSLAFQNFQLTQFGKRGETLDLLGSSCSPRKKKKRKRKKKRPSPRSSEQGHVITSISGALFCSITITGFCLFSVSLLMGGCFYYAFVWAGTGVIDILPVGEMLTQTPTCMFMVSLDGPEEGIISAD